MAVKARRPVIAVAKVKPGRPMPTKASPIAVAARPALQEFKKGGMVKKKGK